MMIDAGSDVGRLRLRVADTGDLPYLPDSVYVQTLVDNGNNLPKAAKTCAMYILGMLAHKTHKKLGQIEVFGQDAFKAYMSFLLLTVKDPAFMDISPIPYSATSETNPLIQFQQDWNKNYYSGTESQQTAMNALRSPHDGSTYGFPYE